MQKPTLNTLSRLTFTISFLSVFETTVLLQSCEKIIHDVVPPFSRSTFLITAKWGLTSATSIDSLSTGSRIVYKGLPADSLNFAWALDPNIDIYGINSFFGGVNTQYNINRYGFNRSVSSEDTVTIASDTFMLTMPWKKGYSDTLFVTKTSPTQLVFNVRYMLDAGSGVEVDSLRAIGHY